MTDALTAKLEEKNRMKNLQRKYARNFVNDYLDLKKEMGTELDDLFKEEKDRRVEQKKFDDTIKTANNGVSLINRMKAQFPSHEPTTRAKSTAPQTRQTTKNQSNLHELTKKEKMYDGPQLIFSDFPPPTEESMEETPSSERAVRGELIITDKLRKFEDKVKLTVENALVGKDAQLKKNGDEWSFQCWKCKEKVKLTTGEVKSALGSDYIRVLNFQAISEDLKKLSKTSDFLGYCLERSTVLKEHEEKLNRVAKGADALLNVTCQMCKADTVFAIHVDASADEKLLSVKPVVPNVLASEQFGNSSEELGFQVLGRDNPKTVRDLIIARDVAEELPKRPISFEKHKKLTFTMRWKDETKTPMENAAEFEKRIRNLQADIAEVEKAKSKAISAIDSIADAFNTAEARYQIASLMGKLDDAFDFKLKLKRSLYASISWLLKEIDYSIKNGGSM